MGKVLFLGKTHAVSAVSSVDGVSDDSTGVLLFTFDGLYFVSSLSLFSLHHSSACCESNLRLLQQCINRNRHYSVIQCAL